MVDTFILQLNRGKFTILDYSKFNTTEETILNDRSGFRKWINNATKKDKDNQVYKPRLTLIKRGYEITLKIEFSAPKIIFKNNVDELENEDFELLIKELRDKLKDMGVLVFSKYLEEANVLSFHPSKNILLKNGYTSTFVLKELSKADIDSRLDLDSKEYTCGKVVQFYSNSHSFVIYDKVGDLNESKKRAIDKDKTQYQTNIFDAIKIKMPTAEILRIEIRLTDKRKMQKILSEVGFKNEITFKNIFNKKLSQKIILLYWDKLFSKSMFVFHIDNNPQSILQKILRVSPKIKLSKAIKIVGLYLLSKDEEGLRGFKSIVNSIKKGGWSFIKKTLKVFDHQIFKECNESFIKDIEEQLNKFNSLRLKL